MLYLGIGYFAARGAATSLLMAVARRCNRRFADASVGWAISGKIGPGQLPARTTFTPARWAATAVMVVALAASGSGGRRIRAPPRERWRSCCLTNR